MIIDAVVEMPGNTNYKYEVDKTTGDLTLDRVLSINVPFNYGYVPKTLSADGDPLDVFIVSRAQILPKTRVKVAITGVIKCVDNGEEDNKLVGYLAGEEDLDSEKLVIGNHILYYLNNYKPGFEVKSYETYEEAVKELEVSAAHYDTAHYVPESVL